MAANHSQNSLERRARAYATVERAIRYLQARRHEQPSLAEVAAHVQLSPAHLQRVFADWAGISPKRFMQVANGILAQQALRQHDVLGASIDLGLSSPGRLHDLVVACFAVTPGEMKSGGAGVRITWGFVPTPLGYALVANTERGICQFEFFATPELSEQALRAEWPNASITRDDAQVRGIVEDVFSGGATKPLHALVKGTNFQVRVWNALVSTAHSVCSYSDLARDIGQPNATRAVASALGQNKIALVIPCHRVIRQDGVLGGYRWDGARKAAALILEGDSERSGALDG